MGSDKMRKSNRPYVLIIVIQEYEKAKAVLTKLEEIGVPGATVMDTMGGASGGRTSNFNKTIFSVIPDEDTVLLAMDEVGEILGMNEARSGEGIMFTVPLVGQMGLL